MTKIGKGLFGGALGRRDFLQATGLGLAAPMLMGLPDFANAQEKVELTMWAWTPDTQVQADMFTKKFPNITVKVENVGQGAPHYVKLRNALQAGSGLPDLAQMEFNSVLSFRQLGALADIGAGVNSSKDKFIDWTWKAVSDGDKVYGVPWDSGPMGVLYRGDIFDTHKITPPDTWDAFAESAMKLAKDAPGTYLTDFGAADPGWVVALLWQAGWRPFHTEGTNIRIKLNDDIAKKWGAYWQKLLDAKAIDTKPVWTTEWFAGLDNGTYATWVTAAWAPILMQQSMKKSFGKWKASSLPQWKAGDKITANLGGSTIAVMTSCKHPKEAAMFAAFMGSDPEAARLWNTKQFLFPVLKELIDDKELMGHKYDFYGGQAVNEIFAVSENQVDPSFEFAPFQDYVNQVILDEFSAAIAGKGTLPDAFDRLQDKVVSYAQDQGFTVS
ncbi:extracellular solute-binding protein [Rhizobium sp. P44RR-XXIV]|uniref:ABC transporter substrate-binding protein n=1 Tax=Rhizobium sp. P44RR-XXIV TaxID=1921145 RepID=UPI0009847280|nr:extracellular solute-binding protein [Rhizobium sp. P44RR-XXIV]TIX87619.1 extracellular solute-binding protein [Rhizobium sp. P44RR-XXIV]